MKNEEQKNDNDAVLCIVAKNNVDTCSCNIYRCIYGYMCLCICIAHVVNGGFMLINSVYLNGKSPPMDLLKVMFVIHGWILKLASYVHAWKRM